MHVLHESVGVLAVGTHDFFHQAAHRSLVTKAYSSEDPFRRPFISASPRKSNQESRQRPTYPSFFVQVKSKAVYSLKREVLSEDRRSAPRRRKVVQLQIWDFSKKSRAILVLLIKVENELSILSQLG